MSSGEEPEWRPTARTRERELVKTKKKKNNKRKNMKNKETIRERLSTGCIYVYIEELDVEREGR